ncbi:MAG TPA: LysM peptidoglycan-binding domain-containing protein [Caulobacteraceae bacterium]
MVAVVAGVGLGLERSSVNLLGAGGTLGTPEQGIGGDQVYVNAANGNLVDTRTDQILTGFGPDDVISETYDSLGNYAATLGTYVPGDTDTDGFMGGYQRSVGHLIGTLDTPGSVVTRIAADGSKVLYSYQTSGPNAGLYQANEDGGAYDTLSYNAGASQWAWVDGKTQLEEVYDAAHGGRIVSSTDVNNRTLSFQYTGSLLTSITTSDNGGHQDTTTFNYTGSQLSSVTTSYWSLTTSSQQSFTQEYYQYDTLGRLSAVGNDNGAYGTYYGYSGGSDLITSISQSDGSSVTFTYDDAARVLTATQNVGDGTSRTTSFSYDYDTTLVTDPMGIQTRLVFDDSGQLTQKIVDPAGLSQLTQYAYDAMGNVTAIAAPDGTITSYTYDADGNRLSAVDGAGDTTTWTYNAANQVATQANFVTPAQNGVVAANAQTTYFVYRPSSRTDVTGGAATLAYMVTPAGKVTYYPGAANSPDTGAFQFTNDVFTGTVSLANLTSWASGLADIANSKFTSDTFDFRGNVQSTASFGADTGLAVGDASQIDQTDYIYDSAGRLLIDGPDSASSQREYFSYDGLGRVVSTTSLLGATTTTSYSDYVVGGAYDGTEVVQTLASGETDTSIYNLESQLVSYTVAGSGIATSTTTYKYDADGRLMMETDGRGFSTYYLYDTLGRQAAKIAADGGVTEYRYNADGEVAATIAYATPLTSGQLATLAGAGAYTAYGIASFRPAATAADTWNWSIYDAAHRLIETIDGDGDATAMTYDGEGNVVTTTQYANPISASILAQMKTPASDNTWATPANALNWGSWGANYAGVAGTLNGAPAYEFTAQANAPAGSGSTGIEGNAWAQVNAGGTATFTVTVKAVGSATTASFGIVGNALGWGSGDSTVTVSGPGTASLDFGDLWQVSGLSTTQATTITVTRNFASADIALGEVYIDYPNAITAGDGIDLAAPSLVSNTGNLWAGGSNTSLWGRGNVNVPTAAGTLGGIAASAFTATTAAGPGGAEFSVESGIGVSAGSKVTTTLTLQGVGAVTSAGIGMWGWQTHWGSGDDYTATITSGPGALSDVGGVWVVSGLSTTQPTTVSVSRTTTAADVITAYIYIGYPNSVAAGASLLVASNASVTVSDVGAVDNAPSGLVLPQPSSTDRITRNFYDNDGRLVGTIDPSHFVTQIVYDDAGQKIQTIAYSLATSTLGPTFNDVLSFLARPNDDHTAYVYDARGLLRAERNGDGDVTQYQYDQQGNLTKKTVGQFLAVSTPLTLAALSALPASGAGIDSTTYTYNAAGQVLTSTFDPGVLNDIATNTYDALGNLLGTVDPDGHKTFFYYDAWSRKTAEVDALGTLTTWTYDADSNVAAQTTYGDFVALPTSAGGAAPSPVNGANYRQVQYGYDAVDRLTTTTQAAGSADPIIGGGGGIGTYSFSTGGTITDTKSYDAEGRLWRDTDVSLASYVFYDAAGRAIAKVDPAGYLTSYVVDTFGDTTQETQYATALASGTIAGFAAATDSTAPGQGSVWTDRISTLTYDSDGNLTSNGRLNVAWADLGPEGGLFLTGGTSTVTYGYNFLGELVAESQASFDTTTYTYDNAGLKIGVSGQPFQISTGAAVTPQTTYAYDTQGRLTTTVTGDGASNTRTTTEAYGLGGDVGGTYRTETDASGFQTTYYYDAAGLLTNYNYNRVLSSGAVENDAVITSRDALGRVVAQATASYNGSTWVVPGDWANTQYDAYGEVTGKGINATLANGYQEHFVYDGAGRKIESNENSGSTSFYFYNPLGDLNLVVASAGTDLSVYTASSLVTAITGNGGVAGTNAGMEITQTVYTAKQQAASVEQYNQQLNGSTTANVINTQTYDAFGDLVSQTNALGGVTYLAYDNFGHLTTTASPTVSVTSATGAVSATAPTTTNYYDKDGRLIGTQDADGNQTTQYLMPGTGFDGAQAIVMVKFTQPNGPYIAYGFDVFGDQVSVTDELGNVTRKTYDAMGRLLTQTLPDDTSTNSSQAALTDFYAYDGLGERISQTNSVLAPTLPTNGTFTSASLIGSGVVKQTTDYDAQGRLDKTVDYLGHTATNSYTWYPTAIGAPGMPVYGGWQEASTNSSGLTQYVNTDFFGHKQWMQDYGGYTYAYYYNAAGEETSQVRYSGSTLLENVGIFYYNTGQVASVGSYMASGASDVFNNGYDAAGDKTIETDTFNPIAGCGPAVSLENETATYDAMGRVTYVTDTGTGGQPMSIAYAYDPNSNVREITTTSTTPGASGPTTKSDWFAYDYMNHETVSDGVLGTSGITRGDAGGQDITYNAAGQRVSATSTTTVAVYDPTTCVTTSYDDVQSEWYAYTADGYLSSVTIANEDNYLAGGSAGDAVATPGAAHVSSYIADSYSRDALGRLIEEWRFDPNAIAPGSPTGLIYHQYNVAYDADSEMTSSQTDHATSGIFYAGFDTYSYVTAGGQWEGGQLVKDVSTVNSTTSTTTNTYAWSTTAQETAISVSGGSGAGSTSLSYDGSGYLTDASVSGAQTYSVHYVNNLQGEILDRTQTATGVPTLQTEIYYLNGDQLGQVSNAGPDQQNFTTSINQTWTGTTTPPSASSDFDQTYADLGSNVPAPAASTYTVMAGDTLQSIAQRAWGDASLWYLIADANGLTGSETLQAGQLLTLPNDVINLGNTSGTFKAYNASQATGQLQPNPAPLPHHNGGCGGVGAILAAIVGAAVGFLLLGPGGLLTAFAQDGPLDLLLAGAVTGAASDAASQLVELATGDETSFNWAGVALGAIGGAVTAGIGTIPTGLGNLADHVLTGAVDNLVTQGIGVATGLQRGFDFAGVAAGAVEAGVSSSIGGPLGTGAALLAGAATRSAITGIDYGQSLIEEAPNTVGEALGNVLGGAIDQKLTESASEAAASEAHSPYDGFLQPASLPGDFTITDPNQRVAWVLRHQSTIDLTADVLQIPATAIAGSPDEEFRTFSWEKDYVGDRAALANVYNTAGVMQTDPETLLEQMYTQDLPAIQSGSFARDPTDIVKMDIGNGNINLGEAIGAVNNYLANPAFKDDPLGLSMYKGNYLGLATDMMSPDADVTFKVAGLLLKRVDSFYTDNHNADYFNALGTPTQDLMLDNGYRFGLPRLSAYIRSGSPPPPRPGYLNYFSNPQSEYYQIRRAFNPGG